MAFAANKTLTKTVLDTFPVVETVVLPKTIFVEIQNSAQSPNSVDIELVDTGDTARVAPGEKKPFNATSNAINGTIKITFYGPAEIEINYTDGDQITGGGGAGSATAANQVILQNYINGTTPSALSGQEDTASVIVDSTAGTRSTDMALAYSLKFYGTGGKIDGIDIESGYIADFGTNNRNQVKGINYTVPTSPDFQGFQRVVITYVKI